MAQNTAFTVREVVPGQDIGAAASIAVEASSAQLAAEQVLGQKLAATGSPKRLRALVWHMKDDLTPSCTQLYEPVVDSTPRWLRKVLQRFKRQSAVSSRERKAL